MEKIKIIEAIGFLFLVALILALIAEVNSLNTKMDSVDESVNGITNNNHFSSVVANLSESVFMIQVPVPSNYNPSFVDAIYTDDAGRNWKIGTGFVIKSDETSSYLLTAYHVIQGSQFAGVVSQDAKTKIQGFNYSGVPDLDLAIIKVNIKLRPVKISNAQDIKVGTKAAFMGYPLISPVQVTHEGIISFKGSNNGKPLITVNSFVNNGNSGGPLFLSDSGEVIGVISAREYKQISKEPLMIPENSSIENKIIIENEQKIYNLLSTVSENVQMGIGRATPIPSDIFSLIKE